MNSEVFLTEQFAQIVKTGNCTGSCFRAVTETMLWQYLRSINIIKGLTIETVFN